MNSRQAFRKILKRIKNNIDNGRTPVDTGREVANTLIKIVEVQNPVAEKSQSSISDLSVVSTDEMIVADLAGGATLMSYP